jgi:hypothetical protein
MCLDCDTKDDTDGWPSLFPPSTLTPDPRNFLLSPPSPPPQTSPSSSTLWLSLSAPLVSAPCLVSRLPPYDGTLHIADSLSYW